MSRKSTSRRAQKAAPQAASSRGAGILIALALVLVTVAVYAQVASHEFVDLDDGSYVVNNPHVNTGLTLENVRWAFTTNYAGNYHPITWISHEIDVSLFGMTPGWHHVTNVAWHVLNTLLLFGLLRAMTGALWRSAFVAALFAVHPAHVESVAWVAERKDVLSAFFWFATTWAYVIWVRRPAAWRYARVVGLFALGLMSKPMLVTLPCTLLLLDIWPLDRASTPWARRITEKLPLFALAIASSVVTAIFQHGGGAFSSLDIVPLANRLANAIVSYGRYLETLVWPVNLAMLYPLTDLPAASVALAGAVVAVLTVLAWIVRRSQPYLLVGWLWFLGTLVPVIGLVQVGVQSRADRYTYVPYVGLFIAIAWGGRALAQRVRVPPALLHAAAAGPVVAFAVVAHAQAATWATSETMWVHTVAVTPDSGRAHNSLGVIYGNSGRTAEAAAQFEQAAHLKLDVIAARDVFPNAGRALMTLRRTAEAVPYLERARELSPERADVCHQLALAYAGTNRIEEALATWREAVRLNPRFEDAWFTMGVVLAAGRRFDEARQAFSEVARLNPSRKDAQDALKALGGK